MDDHSIQFQAPEFHVALGDDDGTGFAHPISFFDDVTSFLADQNDCSLGDVGAGVGDIFIDPGLLNLGPPLLLSPAPTESCPSSAGSAASPALLLSQPTPEATGTVDHGVVGGVIPCQVSHPAPTPPKSSRVRQTRPARRANALLEDKVSVFKLPILSRPRNLRATFD